MFVDPPRGTSHRAVVHIAPSDERPVGVTRCRASSAGAGSLAGTRAHGPRRGHPRRGGAPHRLARGGAEAKLGRERRARPRGGDRDDGRARRAIRRQRAGHGSHRRGEPTRREALGRAQGVPVPRVPLRRGVRAPHQDRHAAPEALDGGGRQGQEDGAGQERPRRRSHLLRYLPPKEVRRRPRPRRTPRGGLQPDQLRQPRAAAAPQVPRRPRVQGPPGRAHVPERRKTNRHRAHVPTRARTRRRDVVPARSTVTCGGATAARDEGPTQRLRLARRPGAIGEAEARRRGSLLQLQETRRVGPREHARELPDGGRGEVDRHEVDPRAQVRHRRVEGTALRRRRRQLRGMGGRWGVFREPGLHAGS